jgi:tetratricopeptide (TPR) repeat protein
VLDDDRVAVIPFENLTGDTAFDYLGSFLAQEVANRLYRTGMVRIALPGQVEIFWEAFRDPIAEEEGFEPRMAIAEALQAGILVTGSYRIQGDSLRFFSEISLAREDWQGAPYAPLTTAAVSLDEAIDTVTERLTAAVVWDLDPSWGGFQPQASRAHAPTLTLYRALERAWEAWNKREFEACRRELVDVIVMDSTYLPAKTMLAVVLYHQRDFARADSVLDAVEPQLDKMDLGTLGQWEWIRATVDGDREEVYRAIKRAAVRAPGPLNQLTVASEALRSNRPREAWAVASELDPESPIIVKAGMWDRLGTNVCNALHLLGEYRKELREVRKIREAHPDASRYLRFEIRARAALGQEDEVMGLIDEALRKDPRDYGIFEPAFREFKAHGHPEAAGTVGQRGLAYIKERPAEERESGHCRSSLFGLHYLLQQWEEATPILEEMVRDQPSNPFLRSVQGVVAGRTGSLEEARAIAEEVEARKVPFDGGWNSYYRACIAASVGDREGAVEHLKQAYSEGWESWLSLHDDPDLASLKGYPPFEEFRRPKG